MERSVFKMNTTRVFGKGKYFSYYISKEGETNFVKGCDENLQNGVYMQPITNEEMIEDVIRYLSKFYIYIQNNGRPSIEP
jgi:hypothetical protein